MVQSTQKWPNRHTHLLIKCRQTKISLKLTSSVKDKFEIKLHSYGSARSRKLEENPNGNSKLRSSLFGPQHNHKRIQIKNKK